MSRSIKLELSVKRGTQGAEEIKAQVTGAASIPEYSAGEKDLAFDGLKEVRDDAITAMLDAPDATSRGVASFLASAYRDARYAAGGRRYLQTLGYGNAIRGHFEAAKQAKDNEIDG